MNPISRRLRQMARDLEAVADAFDGLEAERDYYRRQAVKWAEKVQRGECSYAERVQIEALEADRDRYAERLPAA